MWPPQFSTFEYKVTRLGNSLEFQNAVSGMIFFIHFICEGKLYMIPGSCFPFNG